ncbi:MAG: signal peptide peptidase SppA [Clostridia bacterium]|nr:signal peptide peptidase SppA [Clostridia bacterium]
MSDMNEKDILPEGEMTESTRPADEQDASESPLAEQQKTQSTQESAAEQSSTPAAQGGWYNPYSTYTGAYTPPAVESAPKKKKGLGCLFVSLAVLGVLFVVLIAVSFVKVLTEDSAGSSVSLPDTGDDYVAVMYIDSEIAGDYVYTSMYGSYSSYDQVFYIDTIDALIGDVTNRALLLYINSPGGEVTATDELSRAIARYKSETQRPVYAYFGDVAASGAYWIGSFADKIIASKFTTTGSIGVTYGTHIEISELLEKLGVTVTELTAGDNKAMGSMYSPLTDEQKAMYTEQLCEMHELFIEVVATNRGLEKSNVREIADGRTFLASKALEYKLIDAIGYFEDAQAALITDNELSEDIVFYDCIPEYDYGDSVLQYLIQAIGYEKKTSSEELGAMIEKLAQGRRFMAIYQK